MEPTKELVAELKAADRLTRKLKWVLMVGSTLFILGLLTYFIAHTIETGNQLKSLVVGENTIIQNQSSELAQIKANQIDAQKQNASQLQAIQALLQQQDDYIKCLARIYPNPGQCTEPSYVIPTYVQSTQPQSNSTPSSKSSTPSSTGNTSNTGTTSGQGNGNSGGNSGGSGNTGGSSGGKTPPPKQNIFQQILSIIGL